MKNQSNFSASILAPTTAGIDPEDFSNGIFFIRDRRVTVVILTLFLLIGFGLRLNDLGAESLSEDELNKLETVAEYRVNGLSGKNGEHPFLMKGLQTMSTIAAEKLNDYITAPQFRISDEAALRFPLALFGTFSVLLLFLLVSELFGRSVGLISAALWAVEPMAIGFDRVAKEDSLVLFFFLLTSFFWIRGQTSAERGDLKWIQNVWIAAVGFGALMASKYYPHLLAIILGYNAMFGQIPGHRWRLGTKRWIQFFILIGVAFLVFNPTVLLPETWREILKFSSESRIGHDSYEFCGNLYQNRFSAWFAGVPWTFYYLFIGVKSSISTLCFFVIGLPLIFRRRQGDGRFFIFLWAFFWFLPFTVIGGKFARYFTFAEPLVLIVAAVGFCYLLKWISNTFGARPLISSAIQIAGLAIVLGYPLYDSIVAAPHFRLFTNSLGTQISPAGSYFPHDEFYDASSREIVSKIAGLAPTRAKVASETPTLLEHYARLMGREDLIFISLSERAAVRSLAEGDFVVAARGRRYFSNSEYLDYMRKNASPVAETTIGGIVSAQVYQLNAADIVGLAQIAGQ